MRNWIKSGLKKQKPLVALVLMHEWLAGGIGTTYGMTHAALLLCVAGFAGLGFELANNETVAGAIGIELPLGGTIATAKAGVAGAGFEQFNLLVALYFVGAHGGATLVAGQVLGVIAGVAPGTGFAAALAGHREGRARLGVGGTEAQGAK